MIVCVDCNTIVTAAIFHVIKLVYLGINKYNTKNLCCQNHVIECRTVVGKQSFGIARSLECAFKLAKNSSAQPAVKILYKLELGGAMV